jgi:hypothetical protein
VRERDRVREREIERERERERDREWEQEGKGEYGESEAKLIECERRNINTRYWDDVDLYKHSERAQQPMTDPW